MCLARLLRPQFTGPRTGNYRPASVRFSAYSRQADAGRGGASAHREAEGRRVPTEFLPNSWLFAVGVLTSTTRALRARALSLTTHRCPRRGLGRA